jgi:hypothetical protein
MSFPKEFVSPEKMRAKKTTFPEIEGEKITFAGE